MRLWEVAAGRTRWRIESEGFNILKNHGYELEHNWGHGKQFCAMMLASFNLLAMGIHTAADLLCQAWKKGRISLQVRRDFFSHLKVLTARFLFNSWTSLLASMANPKIPLQMNTS